MLETFGNKMEQNAYENRKLFYGTLRNMRKPKDKHLIHQIKNVKNEELTKPDEIINEWERYFKNLFDETITKPTVSVENMQETNQTETKITMEELEDTIRKLKNGKAAGKDKISPEMIKYLDKKGKGILLDIMNQVWDTEEIPKIWCETLIVPIFKSGDESSARIRGINLLNTVKKILEQIITNKLRTQVPRRIAEWFQKRYAGPHIHDKTAGREVPITTKKYI